MIYGKGGIHWFDIKHNLSNVCAHTPNMKGETWVQSFGLFFVVDFSRFVLDSHSLVVKSASALFVFFHVTQMYECVCVCVSLPSHPALLNHTGSLLLAKIQKQIKLVFHSNFEDNSFVSRSSFKLQTSLLTFLPQVVSVSVKSIMVIILFFKILLFHKWIYDHLFILFWHIYQKLASQVKNNSPYFNKNQTVYSSLDENRSSVSISRFITGLSDRVTGVRSGLVIFTW